MFLSQNVRKLLMVLKRFCSIPENTWVSDIKATIGEKSLKDILKVSSKIMVYSKFGDFFITICTMSFHLFMSRKTNEKDI